MSKIKTFGTSRKILLFLFLTTFITLSISFFLILILKPDNPHHIPDNPTEPQIPNPPYDIPANGAEIISNNLTLEIREYFDVWGFTGSDSVSRFISRESGAHDKDGLKDRHKSLKNFYDFKQEIIDNQSQDSFIQEFISLTGGFNKADFYEIVPVAWKITY